MPSNYKRLGDYIHKVENRNRDLKVSNLVGLSMTKEFRVSTSNIVGTDMSVYKVVNKWQFSCDFMSVIRVHKFPVVLKTDDEPVLVSPAYTVFEVNDENELNPEYLMMWFRRSEFDRYADFKCDSAIRGGFDWDALCDCMLPIPSIEKQQEIVREYNTIQNRIELNNQLISKLEETAQAIYKQWFVDFEFPHNLCHAELVSASTSSTLGYKSAGGKMVWCEELEKEIPEGWEMKRLNDFIDVTNGYAFTPLDFVKEKEIPVIKISNINDFKVSLVETQYSKPSKQLEKYKVKYGDILITLTGSHKTQINSAVGKVAMYNYRYNSFLNQRVSKINSEFQSVIYQLVKSEYFRDYLMNGATGSANQANISPDLIKDYKILFPANTLLMRLDNVFSILRSNILKTSEENQKLEELKDLLLAKMTRVESENSLLN